MASRQEKRRPPARTAEGRELEMTSLAMDLAEEQLRNGTATSQVITHFLKLGTIKEQHELQKVQLENELLKTKKAAMESAQNVESMYEEAIKAFRGYAGQDEDYGD